MIYPGKSKIDTKNHGLEDASPFKTGYFGVSILNFGGVSDVSFKTGDWSMAMLSFTGGNTWDFLEEATYIGWKMMNPSLPLEKPTWPEI